MKKYIVLLIIGLLFISKPVKSDGLIGGTIGDITGTINNLINTAGKIQKYVLLVQELRETYSAIDQLFCLRNDLEFKLEINTGFMGGCLYKIQYDRYLQAVNNILRQLHVVLLSLQELINNSTNIVGNNANEDSQTLTGLIQSLNDIQAAINSLINLMKLFGFEITQKAGQTIDLAIMQHKVINAGKATIILE